jgi:hypothetical protein
MRIVLLSIAACLFLAGCQKPTEEVVKAPAAGPPGAAKGGPQGSITPLGVGAGAMTPITGTETLGGTSGGGIGQAAKDRARNTQNQATTVPEGEDGSGDQ